jgi:hypothetical protein
MLLRSPATAVAATLAFAAAASAQVGFYTFSQSVGTYVPVTGGTIIATATSANTLDDATFPVTLPFAVTYDNATYSQIQVNTNGWISYGGTSPGTTNYSALSSTAVTPGFVAGCAADLQGGYTFTGTRTTGSNQITAVNSVGPLSIGDVIVLTGIPAGATITAIAGNTLTLSAAATTSGTSVMTAYGPWSDIRWDAVGTAPNREIVVQWSNFRRWSTGNSALNLNFQVRLRENGEINASYGSCSPGISVATGVFQTGLRGPSNAFPANVNNRLNVKGTSDWATSAPGTLNSSGQLFNNTAPANIIPLGLSYTWAPPVGVVAANTTLGTGCGAAGFNSFYANYADAALASAALSGNALSLNPTATGYVGTWLPTAASALFVTPTAAATTLAVGDDGVVAVTPSIPLSTPFGPQGTLQVSGNGIIGFGATPAMDYPGTNSYTPIAGGFLNSTLGGFYAWHDYNSSEVGSGPVVSEEIGGTLYVTYNGVENYSTPTALNPSTLQFQLDLATGVTRIVWVSVDSNTTSSFGSAHLVGVSAPGASRDPGSVDLATAALVTTPEFNSLALTASNRPVQGAAASTWDLVLSNVQPTAVIGVDIFGISDPGILDLGLFGLGQAGCQLRANLDVVNAWLASGSTHNYSLTIPPSPSLNNFEIYTQSAILGNGSSADNTTSNGIKGTVGNL